MILALFTVGGLMACVGSGLLVLLMLFAIYWWIASYGIWGWLFCDWSGMFDTLGEALGALIAGIVSLFDN